MTDDLFPPHGISWYTTDIIDRKIDEKFVLAATMFVAVLITTPLLFIFGWPALNSAFFIALFVSGTLNIFALIFFYKAIKSDEINPFGISYLKECSYQNRL